MEIYLYWRFVNKRLNKLWFSLYKERRSVEERWTCSKVTEAASQHWPLGTEVSFLPLLEWAGVQSKRLSYMALGNGWTDNSGFGGKCCIVLRMCGYRVYSRSLNGHCISQQGLLKSWVNGLHDRHKPGNQAAKPCLTWIYQVGNTSFKMNVK